MFSLLLMSEFPKLPFVIVWVLKMKKWSSQWTQFMKLCKEAWKKKIEDFNGVWTRDLAIPVRCSINWAMKPLTLGAGQSWRVHMFPWKTWVLMIYKINHIWTAEMKWKWRNDRRSDCYLVILCLDTHENKVCCYAAQKAFKVCSCTNSFSFIEDAVNVVYCLFKLTSFKLQHEM